MVYVNNPILNKPQQCQEQMIYRGAKATLDHQKFTRVPSAPNALPTTKNTKALSYASLAKTGSTLPAKHLLIPNNTQTHGPV